MRPGLLRRWRWPVVAAAVAAGTGLGLGILGGLPATSLCAAATAAGIAGLALVPSRHTGPASGSRRATAPQLNTHHGRLREDMAILQAAYELQNSVFEVSSELVSCVDEADARARFAAALRTWWRCEGVDLFVWERGAWRSLGGDALGEEPMLTGPVQLPGEGSGDLVLDLSPAVDGQAAVVLRGATAQPSLEGRSQSDQRYVAEVLRGQLALSLRRVILFQNLQDLGRTDPLTGCHRRWYGLERLSEQVERGLVLAVAMVDIDFFKLVNDTHGHGAGDEVLRAVGRCLVGHLRTGDLVSRWGGEEFVIVLPNTSATAAFAVAERLRQRVASLGDLPASVTVSIGVAACRMDETAAELLERADASMYQAKESGRNRVILATGDDNLEAGASGTFVRTTQRADRSEGDMQRSGLFRAPD
ncbi:MAG: GGDEF domain-containing protein [Planctomycetota bacterium]|jgi:diguanylate cyclase (GGDEF)-like protein|nr:GGDEF domain-containing protein [Planctomycetota bacterium]